MFYFVKVTFESDKLSKVARSHPKVFFRTFQCERGLRLAGKNASALSSELLLCLLARSALTHSVSHSVG